MHQQRRQSVVRDLLLSTAIQSATWLPLATSAALVQIPLSTEPAMAGAVRHQADTELGRNALPPLGQHGPGDSSVFNRAAGATESWRIDPLSTMRRGVAAGNLEYPVPNALFAQGLGSALAKQDLAPSTAGITGKLDLPGIRENSANALAGPKTDAGEPKQARIPAPPGLYLLTSALAILAGPGCRGAKKPRALGQRAQP